MQRTKSLRAAFAGRARNRLPPRASDSRRARGGSLGNLLYGAAENCVIRLRVYPLVIQYLPQLVRYCQLVSGASAQPQPAFRWTVVAFAWSSGGAAAAAVSLLAQADVSIVVLCACVAGGAPFALWSDVKRKAESKRRRIVSELPTFMHKLALLLSAGETLPQAWGRAGTPSAGKGGHPLYAELEKTAQDIRSGVSFPKALEDMHRRCGYPEIGALVTTVLMNYKRGGESFALALQDASRLYMERKQAAVRTKGEEASAKLLFPMILMLAAVLVIVAAPAVMMMQ